MAKPYDYDCSCGYDNTKGYKGRQSDILFNGELHNVYEAVKHIADYPSKKEMVPKAAHRGSLWLDQRTNQLYMFVGFGYKHDRVRDGWLPVFADKFQVFDEMMSDVPSSSPVLGQLWLYNDVLMYFDGSTWQPVKALEKADSQMNISMFSDYQIISPMSKLGSTVITDFELEAFLALQKRYFEGDIDISNHADASLDRRWNWGDRKPDGIIDFDLDDISYQYIVPSMKFDRIFMDDRLDINYILQSDCVIQYKRSYLIDEQPIYDDNTPMTAHVKTPSVIHVNPGKLSGVKKRLFKIDRMNPKICCPALNTEYYGYRAGDIRGHFLIPTKDVHHAADDHKQLMASISNSNKEALNKKLQEYGYNIDSVFVDNVEHENGDYEKLSDGIYLSYKAAQQYDYVLAITFEFSWMNSTGQLRQGDTRHSSCSFYVPNHLGTTNIFINGFDYEDSYFSWDHKNQVVTVAEDISDKNKFDVSVLNVFAHEYGYIREVNMTASNRKAHISTVRQFIHPLLFVNGEALIRSQWRYFDRRLLTETDIPGTAFSITGVKKDMCWTVIDMYGEEPIYDSYGNQVDTRKVDICIEDNGYIPFQDFHTDIQGNPAIPIPEGVTIAYESLEDNALYELPHVILFVNGLMVKREDVRYDKRNNVITCEGLRCGMHYVLLDDREDNLYTEKMSNGIKPALSIGKIDETLVYFNGYLLNEKKSYRFEGEESHITAIAKHGEIRAFKNETAWKVFDTNVTDEKKAIPGVWRNVDEQTINDIRSFSNSYVSSTTAVAIADEIPNTSNDEIVVFGYQLTGYVKDPLVPVTCWLHMNDNGSVFLKEAGYNEGYAKIIKADKADAVYLNKIDPADPDLISRYMSRKYDYYYFLIRAFNLWKEERGFDESSITFSELTEEYQKDARKSPEALAEYLTGYFYDDVYMRTKADEYNYIDLRETAWGSLWVNKIFIGKDFNPATDYVMVWINGVRQYPDINYVILPLYENDVLKGYNIVLGHYEGSTVVETVNSIGYIKTPIGTGNTIDSSIGYEPLTGILTYVIQRAENGASKACYYTILDHSSMVEGAQNVYTTRNRKIEYADEESLTRDTSFDFSLYPGKVTIYADGVRLPKSAYTIIDNYTIAINDTEPWIGGSRYPEEPYLDHNGQIQKRRHLKCEELLVEVRQNSQWNERTVSVNKNFYGDIYLYADETNLPYSILDTQDTLMIFIDGLYYGLTQNDGYILDKTANMISIKDGSVISALRKDDIEAYLAMNSSLQISNTKELAAYRVRQTKKLHQITLEWR